MAGTIKGITIEIGGDVTQLDKALSAVNKNSRSLQGELRQVDKLLKFDTENVTLAAQKQEILTEAVEETKKKLNVLEEAEKQVQQQFERGEVSKEQYRALQREIESTKGALNKYEKELQEAKGETKELDAAANSLGGEMDELGKEVKDAGENADGAAEDFTVMKGALADIVADGIEAVGDALKDMAGVQEQAANQFQAATGMAAESMDQYNEAIQNVYKRNFGESLQDVAEKMALVKQATGELDATKLQEMTENLYTLEDTFGMDFSETIRGVQALMNHFGISADEAFNLMATGAQNGLNYTDELGDNVSEYAGKFAEAGYSTEEYFQLLENGTNGGAYNLDKVNDAINEVTTRLGDGTIADTMTAIDEKTGQIKEGTGIWSQKTEELFKKWQDGGATQKDVIDSIVGDIQNAKGEQEKMNLAAKAFGTMAEDGGTKFIESLTSVGNTFDETKGKMEEIKQIRYDDVMSQIEEVGRTVQMDVLAPLLADLMPAVKDLVDFLGQNMPLITALITGFVAAFAVFKIIGFITSVVSGIQSIIGLVQMGLPIMEALNMVLGANPIGIIIAAIAGLVVAFITLWNTSDEFRQFWLDLWEQVKIAFQAVLDFLSPAIENVKQWFLDAWENIKLVWAEVQPYFMAIWEAIQQVFSVVAEVLGAFFSAAWDFIKAIWDTGIVQQYFATIWENIKIIFSVVQTVLGSFFSNAWEAIKAVWSVVAGFFRTVWETIKGIFAVVQAVLSGDFRGAWNAIKGIWDTVSGYFQNVWQQIKNIFSSVKSFFSDTFRAAWDAVKNVFSNWASFFGNLWDIIKNKFSAIGTNIANAISGSVRSGINGVISSIESVINSGIGLINGAIGLINKIPGVSIGGMGYLSLPRLWRGGALEEGSAIVAEAGPELIQMVNGRAIVTPLSSTAQNNNIDRVAGKGGNTFTQNVNITSNKELSPSEAARQTRNATRAMIAALARG